MPKKTDKALKKAKTERMINFYVVNVIIRESEKDTDISAETYATLFRDFYQNAIRGRSSESKACILATNAEVKLLKNNLPMFYGTFVEYTNIDSRKWFNIVSRTPDTEFHIPENLKANYKQGSYFFFSDIHRFCYSCSAKELITPANVENYLRNAFDTFLSDKYEGKYYAQINFEKEEQTVKEILDAEAIYSLEISITYPNGDFEDKAQKFVSNDVMRNSNINQLVINASNTNKEPIDVSKNELVIGAIENSKSNGYVIASIKPQGRKKKKVTTLKHPAKIPIPQRFAIPEFFAELYNFFKTIFN